MIEEHRLMRQLLAILADGQRHQYSALSGSLSCGVGKVKELLQTLKSYGVLFEFHDFAGSDEPQAISWVDPKPLVTRPDIMDALACSFHKSISRCSVQLVCESTNDVVASMGVPDTDHMHIAFSEYQTKGRGRRNGIWLSPLASGICLTLATTCPPDSKITGSLTLAIGVALCHALDELLTEPVLLKWPNDLVLNDCKLGGILTHVQTHTDDRYVVSAGIGINVDTIDMATFSLRKHALSPIGLGSYLKQNMTRAQITARVISHVAEAIKRYQMDGFGEFREHWNHRDYLRYRRIRVLNSEQLVGGIAQGVDEQGALIVDDNGIEHHLVSGEVRVRAG